MSCFSPSLGGAKSETAVSDAGSSGGMSWSRTARSFSSRRRNSSPHPQYRRAVAATVPARPNAVPNRPDAASPAKDATQRNVAQYRVHSRSGTAAGRCRHLLEPITTSGSRNRRPTTKSAAAQGRVDAVRPGSCCATSHFGFLGPEAGRRGRSPHPRSSSVGEYRRSLCDVHTRHADFCRRRPDRPHRRNRLDGHRTTRGVTVQPAEY